MIYTTHEIINRRSAEKGPNSRLAGQNAGGDDLWKGAESGLKRAPIRHKTACFRRRPSGPQGAKSLVFSEHLALPAPVGTRAARGPINKSAEI